VVAAWLLPTKTNSNKIAVAINEMGVLNAPNFLVFNDDEEPCASRLKSTVLDLFLINGVFYLVNERIQHKSPRLHSFYD
jgi:hypothetical protein